MKKKWQIVLSCLFFLTTTLFSQQPLQSVLSPQIALNKTGDLAVVWFQYNQADGFPMIFVVTEKANSTPSAPLELSVTSLSSQLLQFASLPQVAMDDAGDIVVVWQQTNISQASNDVIYAAFKPKNGSFSSPVAISQSFNGTQPLTTARTPVVAMDKSGNAIAVWSQFNVTTNSFMAFTAQMNSSGTWGTPVEISQTSFSSPSQLLGDVQNPQLAINAKGDCVVVWSQVNIFLGGSSMIYAVRKVAGSSTFGSPLQLSKTLFGAQTLQSANLPQVALDTLGDAIVVWSQFNQADGFSMIYSSQQLASNTTTWSDPQEISTTNVASQQLFAASNPEVAIDGGGDAVVVWQQINLAFATDTVIYGASKAVSAATWTTPVAISQRLLSSQPLSTAVNPEVAMDSSGNATAVWSQLNLSLNAFMVMSAMLPTGATSWNTPLQLSTTRNGTQLLTDASVPQIDINASGAKAVVWAQVNQFLGGYTMAFLTTRSSSSTTFSTPIQISRTTN